MTPYLNELINSRITLTDKEAAIVEEYLWSKQQPLSQYQLNSARGRAALVCAQHALKLGIG
jgi:hypothetical protein